MSQGEKAFYYNALKNAGVNFDRHYREYTTEELKAAHAQLELAPMPPEPEPEPDPAPVAPAFGNPGPVGEPGPADPEAAAFYGFQPEPEPTPPPVAAAAPVAAADPGEMAGQRQNTQGEDEPIRTDEFGRVWYQEEVKKPAFPQPRGRRVLTYLDSGTQQQTVTDGRYTETFEIPGDPANARQQQVKITLPSYQVGIYRDPRFPFRVVTYNGNEGFDLFEVQNYYGGAELVPAEIKRKYVENVLCYDIRTVVRAIESEYRQLQLQGKA